MQDPYWYATWVDASLSAGGTFFNPQFRNALCHSFGHASHLFNFFDELREEKPSLFTVLTYLCSIVSILKSARFYI